MSAKWSFETDLKWIIYTWKLSDIARLKKMKDISVCSIFKEVFVFLKLFLMQDLNIKKNIPFEINFLLICCHFCFAQKRYSFLFLHLTEFVCFSRNILTKELFLLINNNKNKITEITYKFGDRKSNIIEVITATFFFFDYQNL